MLNNVPLDQILQGNTLEILPALPPCSVDLIFADPPYNLQLQRELWRPNLTLVDAVDDEWDQFANFAAYDAFTRAWLVAAHRAMNDTATIWVSGTYHNIFRVGAIMQDLGFWLLNTITWHKVNAMPNFRGVRLKNNAEYIIWAKKDENSRYTFNHNLMKQFNGGKQLGSVWAIPACGGKERLRTADGKKLHSTQKPEELLKRIILASTQPGNIILDPFLGSGTSAAVAKLLHRHWIGIERETVYIDAASHRIAKIEPLPLGDPLLVTNRKPGRIPFRALLEASCLQIGQSLYLDTPACEAIILPNGKLQVGDLVGSIHSMGAQLKNSPTCNGWTHWYYEDASTGQHIAIDRLRESLRDKQ